MCVILVSEKSRVRPELVAAAIASNPHGNGFAWIGNRTVHFVKSITTAEAVKLAAVLPQPYVFHARIASVGAVRPELCHPFPMDHGDPRRLKGTSKNGVLFHNGTWTDWWDSALDAIPCATCGGSSYVGSLIGSDEDDEPCTACANTGLASGRFAEAEQLWSDSLAMARIGAAYGMDVVEEVVPDSQRLAMLTPKGVTVLGRGWTTIAPGLRASNQHFLPFRLRAVEVR